VQQIRIGDKTPAVADTAWVANGVTLVGDVSILDFASVWFACVLRADRERIRIGTGSNIQDGCVVHADPGLPVSVGAGVSVGHRAILHGCTVDDDVLIGMGAIVLNGAHIGRGSLVAAGTVVLEGTKVPSNSLVAGVPGKVRRETTDEERQGITRTARSYRELMASYLSQPAPAPSPVAPQS
jgi:carbonic anhydrase/acetyltransferase-like protein (isoleucine patch superfamily)